jgi:predicted RNA binding protein YcfA (HicA-like mRNA interferase family)
MSKAVTFEQLQKTLMGFGFVKSAASGSHVIFRHDPTGVVLTMPHTGTVRPIYVSTAARQIANSGIATASVFENRLEKATKD